MSSDNIEAFYDSIHKQLYYKVDWRGDWKLQVPEIFKSYPKNRLLNCGLPFSERLAFHIDGLKARIKNKMAGMIVIDGEKGFGKTTLAHLIGDYVEATSHINKEEQIALGGKNFERCARISYDKEHGSVIYDEAGDFSKRSALTKANLALLRFFDTFRAFKLLVIACLPNFYALDSKLFEDRTINLLIHIDSRGQAGEGSAHFKVYDTEGIARIRYLMQKFKYTAHKSYDYTVPLFDGVFKDLPPALSESLDKFSTAGKLEILAKNREQPENTLSYYDIAKEINMSPDWVRKNILIHRMPHVEKIGVRRFFDRSILEKFKELKKNVKRGRESLPKDYNKKYAEKLRMKRQQLKDI